MCICVRVWYICVFMCIHVCVCTWLHVWTYWYAHICVCIGVCVFPIFIWHFNPSSIFLYIIYIAHCAIILLCTLMLYICDRSTPDLNKDDELWSFSVVCPDKLLNKRTSCAWFLVAMTLRWCHRNMFICSPNCANCGGSSRPAVEETVVARRAVMETEWCSITVKPLILATP